MKNTSFRHAEREDIPLILSFIKELAQYQHLEEYVVADERSLSTWLFDLKKADVIFCIYNGVEVGFAVYYQNFSTLLGKCGLYLEDLYVKPDFRRMGFGKAILKKLAQIARENNFDRLDWCCLDWNKSSIEFYLSIGAEPMKDWTTYRLAGDALRSVSENQE